jgi:hypothetical protein
MKIYRYIVSLALLGGFVGNAVAQEPEQENIDKTIVIQKSVYVGADERERIEREVEQLDTTIQRPTLDYRIFPMAHRTEFTVQSLTPVEMSAARWSRPSSLYLKVGGGLPLQSELDAYWSPVHNDDMQLTLWANHEGELAKACHLDGERHRVNLGRNQAGLRFLYDIAPTMQLESYVKYRGSLARYYGGVGVTDKAPFMSANDLEAKASLRGRFGEYSPFGYDANLMGLYACNALGEDVWRFNVNFGFLGLNDVSEWLPGRVTLHYSGVQSRCAEPYFDTSVTFVPEWSLRIGRWVPVDIVAGYDYMVYKGAKNTLDGVITSISTAYDRFAAMVPYLKVSNDVQTQVTRNGLWNNPFMEMLPVDSRKVMLVELGLKGEVGKLSYRVAGASRWFSSYFFEVVNEGSPILTYGRNDCQRVWYLEADAQWRPAQGVGLNGEVRYMGLGHADSSTAYYQPRSWRGGLELELRPKGLRSTVLTVSSQFASALKVTQRGAEGTSVLKMPAYVDLGLRLDWNYSERIDLWMRADNLLCQPIYEWATYRALGIGVRGGVKMSF